MWSNCWIFKAGHQIGIDITSSSSFMYLPNPNTGLPLEPDGIWPSGGQPYKGRNVTAHNKIIYGASRVTLPTVDVADLPALQPLAVPAPSTSMLPPTEELHRLGTEALRLVGH